MNHINLKRPTDCRGIAMTSLTFILLCIFKCVSGSRVLSNESSVGLTLEKLKFLDDPSPTPEPDLEDSNFMEQAIDHLLSTFKNQSSNQEYIQPSKLYSNGGLETGPGFWAVFDEIDPIPSPRNPGYAPSCILARMSVAINMTDMFSSGSETRTFFLPNNAVAMNETCGKTEQLLILIWNQTHYGRVLDRMNLTMKFEKEEKDGTLLSQVSLEMYHNHYAGSKFVLEANEAVRLMHSPELFAFCCDEDLNIDLAGIITVFHENGPVQENVSLTLTLSNLCVESFRQSRYYEEITHLTYNCKYGWPYVWVEWAVNGTLALFTLSILAAFVLQNKKIKRLEAAASLLSDGEQSISNNEAS